MITQPLLNIPLAGGKKMMENQARRLGSSISLAPTLKITKRGNSMGQERSALSAMEQLSASLR